MNKIFLIVSVLFFQTVFSQNSETIYYNKDWEVTNKDKALFYRLMPLKELGELILIRDFYINGTPQFEGYALKKDENAYVGDIIWYDENGNDDNFRQYYNETATPVLTYYHQNGKIRKKVQYKDGVKTGETIIYDKDGNVLMKGIYKEGKPSSGNFETLAYNDDYERNRNEDATTTTDVVAMPPPPPPKMETVAVAPQTVEYSEETQPQKKEKKKTITEKIFWENSKQIAQETVYTIGSYDFRPVQRKNYDQSGKLIQSLTEINFEEYGNDILNGTDYEYYLHNNFATGIKSATKYLKNKKSGKAISYFPDGKISSETLYLEDYKEGEEIIYSENGSVKNKRIYKKDEPFNGNFDENVGELKVNLNYINGEKDGEAIAKNDENEIVAKGIYKNGKPFNGTFVVESEEYPSNQELINVENFKKTGLQKVFGFRLDNLIKTYTVQNEKINGSVTFYDNEKPIATLDYKNDEPYNGTLVEDGTATTYKNGKIAQETIYKDDYSDKNEDNIGKQKFYENGILAKISDRSFYITQDPKASYDGIYKNGKPFSGYFETEESHEFVQVDFYENGAKKFQYSNNYLENMDNYRFQEYDIKSTYKDGKIFDGVEYSLQDRQLITKNLKNGVLQSFDWDLFAVHYFNRIHFELNDNSIKINDLDSKKVATIKIDNSNNSFNKELIIDGKTVYSTKSPSSENSEKYYERLILYYVENGKVTSKIMDTQQKPEETENNDEGIDLFYKIFYAINDETKSAQEIFKELGENIGTEEWLKKLENDDILTGIRYNSSGKPYQGILITPNKDNTYSLKLYLEGKMEKQVENAAFKDVKKEIQKLEKLD